MHQLPKIVRERLKATPRSDHPDPDVLTAFAEQSLPGSDRAVVMEHLARCGDCREVIALALPETAELVPAFALRRPWFGMNWFGMNGFSLTWFSMPLLRWGAIAAAFIVMVSVGVVRYRLHSPEKMTAALEGPKNAMVSTTKEPLPSPARTEGNSAAPSSAAAEKTARVAAPRMVARAVVPEAHDTNSNASASNRAVSGAALAQPPPIAAPSADALKSAPKQATASADLFARNAHPSSPVSAQSETVEVQSASPALSTQESAQDSSQKQIRGEVQQSQLAREPSNQPLDQQAVFEEGAIVGKAKAPVAPQAAMGSPVPASRNSVAGSQIAQAMPVSGPRWTITPAGGLQRSYDQGKTWQDVPVNASPAPAATFLQAETSAKSSQKAAKEKEQKSSASLSPIFRAISASGLEIWAGASGGVLYHSLDAGDHWTAATPSQGGVLLTGDIVSVQFSGVLQGKVVTSTSEIWTTADGGQHWSKQ